MKKVLLILSLVWTVVSVKAVEYCSGTSWGYAGTNVTGGGSATPTLVSSESELKSALKSNKVIIITADITVSGQISIEGKNHITLMALPGKKLISTNQTQSGSGILSIKNGSSNIILRNLTFEGPGAFDCDGKDNLTVSASQNIWVDHCDFQDGCDGNFDINNTSDNITVSWCRFRYLKAPRPRDSGDTNPDHTDDHRFSNLVGSSASDKPSDGTYNITYAFCWWDEGCKQRMTRCRNCELHFLNCYWNSSVADYYVGPQNAKCYFEGCTFSGKANSPSKIWSDSYGGNTNLCTFVNCTGNLPSNSGNVSAPSYTYDQLSAADAKNYVTNSTCGAGATLTVTNSGEVSSSCDGEVPPVDPPVVSDWWNISDDDFKNLGTITSETTVRNLHIVATSDKAVTIEANSQTLDTIQFTHRLKLNGTGANNSRHLWFDVTGNCTVTIYLMSAKSTEERTLNIATGSFCNIASTLTAGTSLAAKTYSYTGSATRIYLYPANSGINIYGIKLAYPSPTGMDRIEKQSAAHKVLRNGQVVILREGRTYSILGARID